MSGIRKARLALLCALLAALLASQTSAQSSEQSAEPAAEGGAIDLEALEKERQTRARLYPVRHRISRYLGAAAEAVDETNTDEALELLAKLNPDRLNPYERALVYRLQAYVSYSAGDTQAAIDAFEKVLAEQILPLRDDVRIRFNIAQLYAGMQQWKETIAALERWFPYVEDPDPLAYYLLAVAHFQLDELEPALVNAEKAVDLSDEPREGWLQLLAALYIQNADYVNATPVLEELVLRFPKKLYWVQLSLIYGARENYRHSLASQQVAHAQGLLTEDKELRRLARSYLYADLPHPAARILHGGLEEGSIESDAEAHEMLANSWIAAREYEQSLGPLERAAELSDNGDLYVRLAQVRLQREEWPEAAGMLQKAVDKGSLENPGNALLLLGISHYNQELVGAARSYFVQARKHEKTRPQAERWIKHLETEAQTADAGESEPANPT